MPRTKTKQRRKALPAARSSSVPARKAPTGVSKAKHSKTEAALATVRKRASHLSKQLRDAPMMQIGANSLAIQGGAALPAAVRGAFGLEGVGPVPIEWIFAGGELALGLYLRQPAAIYAAGGSIAPWTARLVEDVAATLADGGGFDGVKADVLEAFLMDGSDAAAAQPSA